MNSLSNFEKSNMRAYSDLGVFFNLGGKDTLFKNITKMLGRNNPPEEMKTLIKVAKVVAFIALNIITVLMYVIYKAVKNSAQYSMDRIKELELFFTQDPNEIINLTSNTSIADQIAYDFKAKNYLEQKINELKGSCEYIATPESDPVDVDKVEIGELDKETFSVEYAATVQDQMGKDAGNDAIIAIYGVASQFNGAEATSYTPVPIGQAEERYSRDHTQGPGAQRMYPVDQVEIINKALYMGRNSIVNVLDDSTKHTLKGGYLIPATKKDAAAVIEQFKTNGHNLVSTCIGNKLRPAKDKEQTGDRTEKIYMVLSAAPAFGYYLKSEIRLIGDNEPITVKQKAELSFQVTLREYRSLFEYGLRLAQQNDGKQVVIKPCALGLGAFANPPEAVAKAYYQAASEYADKLKEENIKVKLQIRPNTTPSPSPAQEMATYLKSPAYTAPEKSGGGEK